MSRWSQGFFALLAASLAFCAVHLEIASGSDLKALTRGDASLFGSRGVETAEPIVVADAVNRAAKADRISGASMAATSGPTIVFMVAGLKNTSVATFMPAPSKSSPAPGSHIEPKSIVTTVACEPPVSALTEAARLMVTGRCVT